MATTDVHLNSIFIEHLTKMFPKISDIRVINNTVGMVKPIQYRWLPKTTKWNNAVYQNEYPPIVEWTYKGKRFSYVLKPVFKTVGKKTFFSDTRNTVPNYDGSEEVVIRLMELCVQGADADEMNCYLEKVQPKSIDTALQGSPFSYPLIETQS